MSNSMTDSLRSMSPPSPPSFNRPGTAAVNNRPGTAAIGGFNRPGTAASNNRPGTALTSPVSTVTSSPSSGAKAAFSEVQLMEYIPDLEDFQSEDLTMTVASAPEYKIQQITSLQELDADLVNSKPFSTVDGISLRKLCKFLTPERYLVENDEFWDWENTFTEISSEFRKTFKAAAAAHNTSSTPEPPLPAVNTEPDLTKVPVKETKRFWQS